MVNDTRLDMAGVELHELEQSLADLGRPDSTAVRFSSGYHKRGVTDVALMSDLSRELRASLSDHFVLRTPAVVRRSNPPTARPNSSSGWTTASTSRPSAFPESFTGATDPAEADRVTFCLSTQVGCAMRCAFCLTGKMGSTGT